MDYIENAINKIREEYDKLKGLSQYAKVVAPYVRDELEVFCKQDKEFAQAVVQTDKKLKDCIESTVKGCKDSVSDLTVYKRAVEFYFPGATVHMTLTIDLIGSAAAPAPETKSPSSIDLSFDELFG